jgi:hypothetical protein
VAKKDEELAVLQQVYDLTEFASVEESERPDYVLGLKSGHRFGVELTEIFASAPQARVQKIPGYVGEILESTRYRHRDDSTALAVRNVEVQPRDGRRPRFSINAIVSEAMNVPEFIERLSQAIRAKTIKTAGYAAHLAHVNLVVADRCGVARQIEADGVHATYFSREFSVALRQSTFREVYLVTHVRDRGDVYVPLKMLDLVATMFMVGRFATTLDGFDAVTCGQIFEIAGEVLLRDGAIVHFAPLAFGREKARLFFGNTAVTLGDDGNLSILDLADMPHPPAAQPITSDHMRVDASFLGGLRAFEDSNSFTSPIVFPCRTAVHRKANQ